MTVGNYKLVQAKAGRELEEVTEITLWELDVIFKALMKFEGESPTEARFVPDLAGKIAWLRELGNKEVQAVLERMDARKAG